MPKKKEMTKEELDKTNFRDSVTKRLQGLEDALAAERKAKEKKEKEKKKKARRASRCINIKGLKGVKGLKGL